MKASAASAATKTVAGQPSWRLASKNVEAYLTRQGGHLGPVTFKVGGRKITPFSVAPWATEKLAKGTPEIIKVLRGDFFCMPFGGNARPFRGEKHPVHGETANVVWKLESIERETPVTALHASLQTKVRKGRVDKLISMIDGDAAVYQRHIISGMKGPMNLGHHAMLKFPDAPGSGLLSVSPIQFGQVYVNPVEDPAQGGYSILKPGAVFDSLDRVPTITGEHADLSRYPARKGFEDIAILVGRTDIPFAWTAVTFPAEGYVWFAIKDPRVLRSTLLWMSNGGRHYAPWNGRHTAVMGLEEITGYFHEGLAPSAAKNSLSEQGVPTSLTLDPQHPSTINYIMAVASVPRGFDHVATIDGAEDGQSVVLTSRSGKSIRASVDLSFMSTIGA